MLSTRNAPESRDFPKLVENFVEKGVALSLAFRYTLLNGTSIPARFFLLISPLMVRCLLFVKGDQAMPVLEQERCGTRSALRYRPLATAYARSALVASSTGRTTASARTAAVPTHPDHLGTGEYRYVRHRVNPSPSHKAPAAARSWRRVPPLVFVGLGLVTMLLLWMGVSLVMRWGTNELNTLKYGNPRTFQIDAVVGHEDSPQHPSHFLAVNLHGTVTIIEFPAGDPSRTRVLATTSIPGPDAAQVVVTLRFLDINHNGKPDMLVDINGMQSVLVNDGTSFRSPTPAEQQELFNALPQSQ